MQLHSNSSSWGEFNDHHLQYLSLQTFSTFASYSQFLTSITDISCPLIVFISCHFHALHFSPPTSFTYIITLCAFHSFCTTIPLNSLTFQSHDFQIPNSLLHLIFSFENFVYDWPFTIHASQHP